MAFGDGLSEGFDWDLIRSIDWDTVASMENTVVDDSDMGTGDGSGDPVADAEREATIRSGEELLRAKLKEYGLEALEDWAFAQLREDFNVDTIVLKLPDAETSPGSGVYPFRERFAGMYTGLRGEGVINAITPFQYLQQETSMQEVAAAAGLPRGFYDDPSDFAEFIGNGVTPDEYTERVAMAATAVSNINPELKGQLQELYGIGVENDGELIAYYLDPDRAVSVIEQRLQQEAAGLSGAGKQVLGQGFTRPFAERLSSLNVQQREISDRLGRQSGLVQTRLLGEQRGLTSTEVAASEFGLDPDSVATVRSLRQRRQESARRASGAMASNAGVMGLGSSGSLKQ